MQGDIFVPGRIRIPKAFPNLQIPLPCTRLGFRMNVHNVRFNRHPQWFSKIVLEQEREIVLRAFAVSLEIDT
jgi:hypothetical protein